MKLLIVRTRLTIAGIQQAACRVQVEPAGRCPVKTFRREKPPSFPGLQQLRVSHRQSCSYRHKRIGSFFSANLPRIIGTRCLDHPPFKPRAQRLAVVQNTGIFHLVEADHNLRTCTRGSALCALQTIDVGDVHLRLYQLHLISEPIEISDGLLFLIVWQFRNV
ncbi:hypothetical protein D3C72_1978090 [compost metagenome]